MYTNCFAKGTAIVCCISFLFLSGFLNNDLYAQNAGVNFNGAAPNISAAFDINVDALGTKKGLLIPRVTLAQRTVMDPLPAAAQGLIVYQTDDEQGFYYNTSSTTTPSWSFLVSNTGLRWDLLQNPEGDLMMAHGAHQTEFTFDGFTSPRAFSISSNSITKGSLLDLSSNSTAGGEGLRTDMLNIYRDGANTNTGHIATGIYSQVVNTGDKSTNYGGFFSVSGGNTNTAVMAEANTGVGTAVYARNTSSTPDDQYAVRAETSGNTVAGNNYGVLGSAYGGSLNNYGGFFSAAGASGNNMGVRAETDADFGIGVYGQNTSAGTGTQIGVKGVKLGNTGSALGIGVQGGANGTANWNYGGYFSANEASINYGIFGATNSNGYGVYGQNSSESIGDQYGVYGTKTGNTGTGVGTGVYGIATGSGSENYGGRFYAQDGTQNVGVYASTGNGGYGVYATSYSGIGVYGSKTGNLGSGGGTFYGIYGQATGTATTNVAGYFVASGATTNYGIMVPAGGGKVAVGTNIASANAILAIKDGHLQSQQTTAPTIVVNDNAGIGASASVLATSSDVAGNFTITTGGGVWAAGAQATITFNKTYGTSPKVIILATNLNAANKTIYVTSNTTSFTIFFTAAAVGSLIHTFNYIVIEN